MSTASVSVPPPQVRHQGPPLGMLAVVYTGLFLAGLWPVTMFGGRPWFPGPSASAATIQAFFLERPHAVALCVLLQFGAAMVLGIFTATIVNQMRFLGVRAAGVNIALFGGFTTVFSGLASAACTWAQIQHGVAQDLAVTNAVYYMSFALGGPGFSVPMGLLMLGISIPAAFMRLLPKWICVLGFLLGAIGELSWLNLMFPKLIMLIPLTRFPGFIWLIAAGFALPRKTAVKRMQAAA